MILKRSSFFHSAGDVHETGSLRYEASTGSTAVRYPLVVVLIHSASTRDSATHRLA